MTCPGDQSLQDDSVPSSVEGRGRGLLVAVCIASALVPALKLLSFDRVPLLNILTVEDRASQAVASSAETHTTAVAKSADEVMSLPTGSTARQSSTTPAKASKTTMTEEAPEKSTAMVTTALTPNVTIFINTQWDPILGYKNNAKKLPNCPVQCLFTQDKALFDSADAFVINPRWMDPIGEGDFRIEPSEKRKSQRWVFNFFYEAPTYEGRRVALSVTQKIASGVDWTMSYRRSSDFFQPMWRTMPVADNTRAIVPAANRTQGRSMLLLWLVSNCAAPRLSFFKKLWKLLPKHRVKIYGGCGEPSPCPRGNEKDACHKKLFGRFKFYASFENSMCDGYITEKFVRPIRNGMVPLAIGGKGRQDYEALLPGSGFIHADDFGSMQELANFLLKLDQDDEAYGRYHAWKSKYRLLPNDDAMLRPYCKLCEELYKKPAKQRPTKQFGRSLVDWWYEGSCRAPIPQYAR
eukprot:gnl/TRDRNA2_/TRDRNA2_170007_c1_seq1.p1 gnl/TRDRNA2_/TRDRNA2_170007_c1~~gnl/TRDRNA2_/TRDRNA2_170007_c1_seq1.p1  ORF type:complete len:464 (-),score=81.11 gnl/TRDRNA2_/TRDRNA2_170007_c1_seq1:70-1461(-)